MSIEQKINVLISGLPGSMGREVWRRLRAEPDAFKVLPVAFGGEEDAGILKENGAKIEIVAPSARADILKRFEEARPFIAVDFTMPEVVNENVEWFCENDVPCVVGTTGGNRSALAEAVRRSNVCAVIAPNMAAPIILLQAAMEYLAQTFPGALDGWRAAIRESHQAGKKDTSGTAKAMVEYIRKLGMNITVEEIEKIRELDRQRAELEIPDEHIAGHAYHTYTFDAPDDSVTLVLTHNVRGRAVYAEGTATALKYLHRKINEGNAGKVYSMIDVLKNA
jgi:4-hydroxy-tetrahydrodipicolinate reductase